MPTELPHNAAIDIIRATVNPRRTVE